MAFCSKEKTKEQIALFAGPKGERGEPGPAGPQGIQGEKGERGATGIVISNVQPQEPEVSVWINPEGGADDAGTGGAGVSLDPTLTQDNKAAPADMVGEIRDDVADMFTGLSAHAETARLNGEGMIWRVRRLSGTGSVPVVPDTPTEAATLTVAGDGSATLSGATLTVDSNGNATISGATVTVDDSGNATIK